MKKTALLALVAMPMFALAACGGKGDDKLGEQAQEAMENRADNAVANGTMTPAQGDAMKDAANEKEERIDDSGRECRRDVGRAEERHHQLELINRRGPGTQPGPRLFSVERQLQTRPRPCALRQPSPTA